MYDSNSPYMQSEEVALEATPALGGDVHEAIRKIAEIDQNIAMLRKRRNHLAEQVEKTLNEISRHLGEVQSKPAEGPGLGY